MNFKKPLQANIAFLLCQFLLTVYAAAEGEIKDLKDFEYWDNGKVKQCAVYNASSGKLLAKAFCGNDGAVERIEKYDGYGNKVETALYDGAGRLTTGVDGWAAKRWWYDGYQLRAQISYDEYGKARERKAYSESGNLVLRQYKDDEDVDPYENAAMFKLLSGQNVAYYDSKGALEEVTRLLHE